MTEPHEPVVGCWWRFSRYEVKDGRIRPVRRAKFEEYDPWQDYEASRGPLVRESTAGKRAFVPPYLSLTDLLKELPYYEGGEGDPNALKPAGEALIAEWCAEHGLLGLLPQRATLIALAPVEESPLLVQTSYVRTTDRGWIATRKRARRDRRARSARIRQPDSTELVNPHAIVASHDAPGTQEEPLARALAPFFPETETDYAETFAYPIPLSPAFWRAYAEPVHAFIESAQLLSLALRLLDEARFPREPDDDPAHIARLGLRRLNGLVSPLSPSLHFIDGELRQRWASPSLLASYAMMALLDLEGRRIRACAECGRVFATDAYQTRYCTPAHANRARKRKHRSRLSARPADGKTVE
jgi:hypothetical protein